MFVKIRDFVKFKGFLVEFLENSEKIKNPSKIARKVFFFTFLSLAFYNAPSLDTVNEIARSHRLKMPELAQCHCLKIAESV